MTEISTRLKMLRQRRGLRATDIARSLGVPVSTYRDWEMGREIRGEPYLKLAELLGVSVIELLGGVPRERAEVLQELEKIERSLTFIRLSL